MSEKITGSESLESDTKDNANSTISKNQELKISIGGLPFTIEGEPYIILGKPIKPGEDLHKLTIDISSEVQLHDKMCYTTDLTTAEFIFGKLTLRSSSLTYARLNDKMEKSRVGVTQFAGSRFITCFSHIKHESAALWGLYGSTNPKLKIMLIFKNFANNFSDAIHTDYCLLDEDKKLFLYSDEYRLTLQHNCTFGQVQGLPQLNAEYDIRNCIRSIEMFDIEYLPVNDGVFAKDYSGETDLYLGKKEIDVETKPQVLVNLKIFKPESLGKQKSSAWDYEKESRILCCLDHQEVNEWSFIDLRLKEEIFRDLIIVMSPWAGVDLEKKIDDIINLSPLSSEIKSTITIKRSELEGTLNF